jgi:nickel superoxide dismutase
VAWRKDLDHIAFIEQILAFFVPPETKFRIMKTTFPLFLLMAFALFSSRNIYAHCEVPCGIYHDELRIELIKEHIQTIEKAMVQIAELQDADELNYNQIVRWVNTKEHHAELIQEVAEQYFLHQRVKFADPSDEEKYKKYIAQLTSLHQLIVFAMKSKQSIDQENIGKMNDALMAFEESYFGEHRHNPDGSHK